MRCPSCNSRIDNNLTICNYCGAEVHYQNNHEDQYEYSKSYSNVEKEYDESRDEHIEYSEAYSNANQSMVSSDDDYVNAYLGSNYQQIRDGKFNLAALIFGPLYFSYKKVTNPILWALLAIVVYLSSYVGLFINIYLGYAASSILLKDANKKVEKIKQENTALSSTELIKLCQEKGQGDFAGIAIFLFTLFVLTLVFLMYAVIKG